jgi:hypothetical protein
MLAGISEFSERPPRSVPKRTRLPPLLAPVVTGVSGYRARATVPGTRAGWWKPLESLAGAARGFKI